MKKRVKSKLIQYALTVVIALTIGILLRTFVVQAYRIPSRSMEDTLLEGDFSKDFVKRIVATEGQIVQIVNKDLYIDGQLAEGLFSGKHVDYQIFPAAYSNRDNFGPFRVPEGQYFVLGDNRDNSHDSREWGFLEKEYIKGKAFMIYFSWAPDQEAPRSTGFYSLFEVLAYNIIHFPSRVRWDRVGSLLR
jgi:signal peptidase I